MGNMSTSDVDRLLEKDPKTGIYHAKFHGMDGNEHSRTTKSKRLEDARKIVREAKLVELDLAARSKALTEQSLTAIMAGRNVTCAGALEEWKLWRKGDAAANTVRLQETILRQLFGIIGADKKPVAWLKFEHLDGFVNNDDESGRSNRDMRLAAIRSYFKFITAKAYYVGNPASMVRVKLNKLSHEQKEHVARVPFTEKEFRHIMAKTEGFWKFAAAISYWTGLRLSDIAALEWATILPEEFVVWTQKGETRVALPLKDPLIGKGELSVIFMEMMMDHNNHPQYCFPKQRAIAQDPNKRSGLSVQFGRILADLGIEGKSFHCFRHAFATRLSKAGKTVEEIGRLVGHAPGSTKTTKGYVHE